MIEPIATVADAEKEFNDLLNIPSSFKREKIDPETAKRQHSEDEFIYFQN